MTQVNIEVGKVSDLLYDLMTSTKATKFRAGFTKVNGEYRVGKFDLLNRSTWKQSDGTMYKRKGKKRTTDPDEYILAHDLDKKAPRNISVSITTSENKSLIFFTSGNSADISNFCNT